METGENTGNVSIRVLPKPPKTFNYTPLLYATPNEIYHGMKPKYSKGQYKGFEVKKAKTWKGSRPRPRARGFPRAFPLPADTKVCLAVARSKSPCKQKKEVVLNMTFRIVCRSYKLHGVVSRKQTRKAYRSQLLIPLVFVSKVLSAAQVCLWTP